MLKEDALNAHARRGHGTAGARRREPLGEPLDRRFRPNPVPEVAGAASEARTRLHAFLTGFGIGEDARLVLVERLLAGACDHHRDHPDLSRADGAVLHAEQCLEAWLRGVLGLAADQPALPAGRAAFLACGGPDTWPDLVMVRDDPPDAFVSAMRAALPPLSPLPAPATMTEQPLDSWSLDDAARFLDVVRRELAVMSETSAWATRTRPLVTASIKLAKPWS